MSLWGLGEREPRNKFFSVNEKKGTLGRKRLCFGKRHLLVFLAFEKKFLDYRVGEKSGLFGGMTDTGLFKG